MKHDSPRQRRRHPQSTTVRGDAVPKEPDVSADANLNPTTPADDRALIDTSRPAHQTAEADLAAARYRLARLLGFLVARDLLEDRRRAGR